MAQICLDMSFGHPKLKLFYKKILCCDWMKYINDRMSEMVYITTCHACVKIDVNYLLISFSAVRLDMQNSNKGMHPSMFIFVVS